MKYQNLKTLMLTMKIMEKTITEKDTVSVALQNSSYLAPQSPVTKVEQLRFFENRVESLCIQAPYTYPRRCIHTEFD